MINFRFLFLASCVIALAGKATFAGNLSLYSFTEGAPDQGMPNITTGNDNVAIGNEALNATTTGSNKLL